MTNGNNFITFGEIMLRLKSPNGERLLQSTRFEATFGGGEANAAVSLANYGNKVSFLSVLPDHAITQAFIHEMNGFKVDCDGMIYANGRFGVYYVEPGSNQRASKVVYDRDGSAISIYPSEKYDWPARLQGYTWFHFTGITPALSQQAANAVLDAVKTAKAIGLTVSCDLNYRSKLWKYGKSAQAVMDEIVPYVDVCIGNEEDCQNVLGIGTDLTSGGAEINPEHYRSIAAQVLGKYPNIKKIAITLRGSISADTNSWSACIFSEKGFYKGSNYTISDIVDRVGGGDSFSGALLHALNRFDSDEQALEFAIAASCLKHTIMGDFNRVTEKEVMELMQGHGSGRIQR